jgi:small subunit ribosomal protein S20
MANTSSARKAARKIEARAAVNKARNSRIKTFIRKVESAVEKGEKAAAAEALKAAQPEIMRAVTKGVLKRETASRKISRLSARIKKLDK